MAHELPLGLNNGSPFAIYDRRQELLQRGAPIGGGRGSRHLAVLRARRNDARLVFSAKYVYDGVYYPTLTAKPGAPYGLYVHGNNDTEGAIRAAESITKGMGWERVHAPVSVIGSPTKDDLEAAWDLAATVAATVAGLN